MIPRLGITTVMQVHIFLKTQTITKQEKAIHTQQQQQKPTPKPTLLQCPQASIHVALNKKNILYRYKNRCRLEKSNHFATYYS